MKLLTQCLAVGAAGFVGAIARFLIALICKYEFPHFPVGTLVVNLTGSFLLGWFVGDAATRSDMSDTMKLAVTAGFIGTYTTFSTFMFESDALMRNAEWMKMSVNLVGSIVLGLIAVRLGAAVAAR